MTTLSLHHRQFADRSAAGPRRLLGQVRVTYGLIPSENGPPGLGEKRFQSA